MPEKEIVIDLSGKIKFSDTVYISLGTFLLSIFITVIQMLICLALNNWQFTVQVFTTLLNFLLALRSGKVEEEEEPSD